MTVQKLFTFLQQCPEAFERPQRIDQRLAQNRPRRRVDRIAPSSRQEVLDPLDACLRSVDESPHDLYQPTVLREAQEEDPFIQNLVQP